jgi:hydroxymethylglutaryl-CoA lyase
MKSKKVSIVEVGLRDGLQNESKSLSISDRALAAEMLVHAGVRLLEIGAFVRYDKVPQMQGTAELISLARSKLLPSHKGLRVSALVPNEKGMLEAIESGVQEIAIFAASSETFSKKNINCSIEESFERFIPVMKLAKKHKIKVRGYLSTCFGCPYEGAVEQKKVISLAVRLARLGCYEISIGDTIGVATPNQVQSLFKKLKTKIPVSKLAGHFHDTRGTALANVLAAYQVGVRVFDSSLGGLGGCPYAPGASGNVATEDVVYMFEGMGVSTGLDLNQLIEANRFISEVMSKKLPSKTGQAGVPKSLGRNI